MRAASAQSPRGEACDLFFTAGVSQVDTALFETIEDRADQVRPGERLRHAWIHLAAQLPEVVEVPVGENDRLELVTARSSVLGRWHEMHSESSDLGVTGANISLP